MQACESSLTLGAHECTRSSRIRRCNFGLWTRPRTPRPHVEHLFFCEGYKSKYTRYCCKHLPSTPSISRWISTPGIKTSLKLCKKCIVHCQFSVRERADLTRFPLYDSPNPNPKPLLLETINNTRIYFVSCDTTCADRQNVNQPALSWCMRCFLLQTSEGSIRLGCRLPRLDE